MEIDITTKQLKLNKMQGELGSKLLKHAYKLARMEEGGELDKKFDMSAFSGMVAPAMNLFGQAGAGNPSGAGIGQNVGNIAGQALNFVVPGLGAIAGPLLGAVGSKIGNLIDPATNLKPMAIGATMPYGGPILPRDSVLATVPNVMSMGNNPWANMGYQLIYPASPPLTKEELWRDKRTDMLRNRTTKNMDTMFGGNSSSKSKSKDRFREYKTGGPIEGDIISYNGPSHTNGGMMVDAKGGVMGKPVAEIEKKESVYNTKDNSYVYSDALNFSPDLTFADKSREISRRLKGTDPITEQTRTFELERLSMKNDMLRSIQEKAKFKQGGRVPKYGPGGGILPPGWPTEPLYPTIPYTDGMLPLPTPMGAYVPTPIPPIDTNLPTDPTTFGQPLVLGTNLSEPTGTTSRNGFSNIAEGLGKAANKVGDFYKNNPYAIPMTGMAAEIVGQGISLLKGYEREKPYLNPYNEDIRQTMRGRNVDLQALKNDVYLNRNAAVAGNNSGSRSINVARSLNANVFGAANRQLSQINLQQDQINNQYRAEEAQMDVNLGSQIANARHVAEVETDQNKGAYLNSVMQFFSNVREGGFAIGRIKNVQNAVREGLTLLNLKYPNAKINASNTNEYVKMLQENPEQLFKLIPNYAQDDFKAILQSIMNQ